MDTPTSPQAKAAAKPITIPQIILMLGLIALMLFGAYKAVGHGWVASMGHDAQAQAVLRSAEGYELQRFGWVRGCNRTYEFHVDGATYEGPTGGYTIPTSCAALEEGDAISVTYNSADPTDNVWGTAYNNNILGLITLGGALFFVVNMVMRVVARR